MHKSHSQRTTKLCHDDARRAPVLLFAQLKSFFSDSQSSYFEYASFAVLKKNYSTALKCVAVGTEKAVESLWSGWDNYAKACVQKVHKSLFMPSQKNARDSYELVVQVFYSGLIHRFFRQLTPLNPALCTLSTMPIKTIYLNKKVRNI